MRLGLIMVPVIVAIYGVFFYVLYLVIKALRKYVGERDTRPETVQVRQSLGEAIKAHRLERNMTQEFVAERLGVSRQAVSKWEGGASEPSTSNLLALAKLFEISPEELFRGVEP